MVLHAPSKLCIALCIIQLAKCEQQPRTLGKVAGAVKSGYSYGAQAAANLWNLGWGKKPPPPAPEPVEDDQNDQPEKRSGGVDIGPVTDYNPEPEPRPREGAREGYPPYGQDKISPEGQAPYGQDNPYQPNNPPEQQRPAAHDHMQSSPVGYLQPQGPTQGQPQGYQPNRPGDDDNDEDQDYFHNQGKEGPGGSEGAGYQGDQRYEPESRTPDYDRPPPPPRPVEFYPPQPPQRPPPMQTPGLPFNPTRTWSGPEQFYQQSSSPPPAPPSIPRLGFTPHVPGTRPFLGEASYQNQPQSSYLSGSGQPPGIPYSGDEGYDHRSESSEYQSVSPTFRYNMERADS